MCLRYNSWKKYEAPPEGAKEVSDSIVRFHTPLDNVIALVGKVILPHDGRLLALKARVHRRVRMVPHVREAVADFVRVPCPQLLALFPHFGGRRWVVWQGRDQVRHIRKLEGHEGVGVLNLSRLLLQPRLDVLFLLGRTGHFDAAHNDVTSVVRLHVDHREGECLVLSADVEELVVLLPHDTLVEIGRVEIVRRFQPQGLGQERIMVQVARAEDDGVRLEGRSIDEVHSLALNALYIRPFVDVSRPYILTPLRAIAHRRACRAVLDAGDSDVFARVVIPNAQNMLPLHLLGVLEILAVQHLAREALQALYLGEAWEPVVTCAHEEEVGRVYGGRSGGEVMDLDTKLTSGRIVGHVLNLMPELNEMSNSFLLGPCSDVVGHLFALHV
mmetsp:Transcript_32943/g.95077  ORF Transcript_32943/g.95077 Transcript_32943/m.95077 type:complete len:386 (+) Transcript_32943:555-1712(+)